MKKHEKPDKSNNFHFEHVKLLLESFRRVTGRDLTGHRVITPDIAKGIFYAPFVLVSHNTDEDPVFNYGNQTALKLFELSWEEFTSLPSRHSAEPVDRDERERLLKNVAEKGFIDDYRGVRISSTGRRFLIEDGTVWNVFDEEGKYHGQAATFSKWEYL